MKSLMLWKHDFRNKRDWTAICNALDVPVNTVEIEIKSLVICAKSNYTNNHDKKIAKDLWREFGEIPMNPETEEIEEEWQEFPIGTHREKIWSWFEETFNVSVAKDLMGL